jgi:hypothetical protein
MIKINYYPINFEQIYDNLLIFVGAESNARSQASRARQYNKGFANVDCDGAQDEGNLPRT